MPKGATYALTWSSSQQTYALMEGEDFAPLNIVLDSPAWFGWLAQVPSFAFSGKSGSYTARRETRHGDVYWYAYLRTGEKLTKKYLGKTSSLTIARLEDIAGLMQADQAASGRTFPPAPRMEHETDIPIATDGAKAPVVLTPRVPPSQQSDPLTPLLATKLHVPRPRAQLVSRPELIERLQEGIQGPLTLVSAPAGFGKTTLLAQWLAESGTSVAWLSLEPEDNEPTRFLMYLIAALQTLDPHIGRTGLTLLRMSPSMPPETALTTLANDLVNRALDDFALVLDDYHHITAEPIHRSVLFLLEHAPHQMHLILVTRADPPWPLARLRARGQLCEVRAAELRFASEEASTFLRAVMRLALSEEEIALLQSRTEGWIAGLQFAALSLRGRSDVSAYLAAFTGSHRFVLDYLSEEVFARQDAPVQSFLLYTSVLDRLSAPLCDAVTGKPGSRAMLEALDHANLFLVSLDDERHWYRYHHLFADVLRGRLRQAEPALVPVLHRRASAWFEQHDMLAEAVQHALAAADFEHAAELIEQSYHAIGVRGQVHLVLGWVKLLPEQLVRTRPLLCIYQSDMLMHTQQLEASEARLQDAERALVVDWPTNERHMILGLVAALRAILVRYTGDFERGVALAQEALSLLPETVNFGRASAMLSAAHTFLMSGDVTPATERVVLATPAPARALSDFYMVLRSFALLSRLQVMQGQLRKAASTYEEAARLVPEPNALRALSGGATYYFGLGDVLREWNRLDEASDYLMGGMALLGGTQTVFADEVTLGHLALARLMRARGEYGRAIATLKSFARLARERHFVPHLLTRGAAVQAQIELARGNLSAALRWQNECGLSTDDVDLSYSREAEYLTLARVLIAQGRSDPMGPHLPEALRLLERWRTDAEEKARLGSTLEILLLQALAFSAGGKGTEALAVLERALRQAEPAGYIRLFVDEEEPMVALLRQAYARGIAPDYVATLLSAAGVPEPAAPPPAGSLLEPLTERELEVLRLLVAGLSNAAMVRELVISVGTVKRHVNSIYSKLAVNSRTQAAARAHALHLL
ncbi:MAG TPA: LuxR C-terminal-related transcriptional regulator [Ktedonobacteraceae bacterium]